MLLHQVCLMITAKLAEQLALHVAFCSLAPTALITKGIQLFCDGCCSSTSLYKVPLAFTITIFPHQLPSRHHQLLLVAFDSATSGQSCSSANPHLPVVMIRLIERLDRLERQAQLESNQSHLITSAVQSQQQVADA